MKYRPLGKNLLPAQFTMNELEGLYSCFLGKQFDKRNFRRRILEMDFLKEITKVQRNTRGRKAILYEFDPKNTRITPNRILIYSLLQFMINPLPGVKGTSFSSKYFSSPLISASNLVI
ncbi:MAG: hypothetical protein CM15mP65_02240 [Crocinitomicaceae bacterium]|nr:MAG: hypothetical protein CM15mP65_02240 [Crocinitomicaceae bacterium]